MTFSSQKTKIAHVDQSYFFRQGLKFSLDQSPNYVLKITEEHIETLVEKLKTRKIDIVLLGDFESEDYSIAEVLMDIININPNISIIAFQSTTNFGRISRLIKMGVKGFIPKNLPESEFIETLLEIRKNGFYFKKEITKNLIDLVQNEQKFNDLDLALSGIEKQILQFVSNGFTAQEISKKLNKSKKTIEGYRYRMLKKAEVRNIAELVAWAFRNNIIC